MIIARLVPMLMMMLSIGGAGVILALMLAGLMGYVLYAYPISLTPQVPLIPEIHPLPVLPAPDPRTEGMV